MQEEIVCSHCAGDSRPFYSLGEKSLCRDCRNNLIIRRSLAFIVDSILVPFGMGLILASLIIAFSGQLNQQLYQNIHRLSFLIYLLFKDGLFSGQSLGKLFLRLKAVDFHTHQPCSFKQSFMRNIILLIPFAPLIAFFGLFSKDMRRIGERWANTFVTFKLEKEERGLISCPNSECGQKFEIPQGVTTLEVTCPQCQTSFIYRPSLRKRRWFYNPWLITFLLFLWTPIGLLLLWINPKIRGKAKVGISIIFALIYVAALSVFPYKDFSHFAYKPTIEMVYEMVERPKRKTFLPQIDREQLRKIYLVQFSRKRMREFSTTEIAGIGDSTVVLIETRNRNNLPLRQGSGFVVHPHGYIVTNYHVLEGARYANVKFANGDSYRIVGAAGAQRGDLAVIKINATNLPKVEIGDSNAVEKGQKVIAVGSPLGLENTISEGIISSIRSVRGLRLFQISAPISSGSSGGPLFNVYGEVIGITTLQSLYGQNLNFAIPIDQIKDLIGIQRLGRVSLED